MNFSLKINFTVVLIIINFISLNGFAYTFYVETSEFNDDVYIIENVISDESNNESNKKSEELELIKENKPNSNLNKNPINGSHVFSTIDVEIQDIVHDNLLQQTINFEADHSSAIVMEVSTGKIKAISNFGRTSEVNIMKN